MYAVIFKAQIKMLDETYSTMASQLRDLAFDKYGCLEFTSCTEPVPQSSPQAPKQAEVDTNLSGDHEIAISYWPSLDAISAWNQDSLHKQAQAIGKDKWYSSYEVEVVEVLRKYKDPT